MIPRKARRSARAACVSLALLTACDLEFPEQEIRFRHNEATDTAEVLFIARGVSAADESHKAILKGIDAAERVLAGQREFMVVDWPFYCNYDGILEDVQEMFTRAEEDPEFARKKATELASARMFLAVEDHVQVEKVGIFLDEEGRLCGYQLVRVSRVKEFLQFINEWIRLQVLDDAKEDMKSEGDDSFWDEETRELWLRKAEGPGTWVDLDGGRLKVDIPMSRATAQRFRWKFLDEMAHHDDDDAWAVNVGVEAFQHTVEARFDPEGMHLVFGHPSGTMVLEPEHPDREYLPGLKEALLDRGHAPDTSLTWEAVRNLVP